MGKWGKRFLILAGFVAAMALLPGCASNKATGAAMHEEVLAQQPAYDNPQLQVYVNRVGQRLVTDSDDPGAAFTFTVVDSPDINAFATPAMLVTCSC